MEILKTGEIDWMLEINKIDGYEEEVIHLRGKYIPVIDLRRYEDKIGSSSKPELQINVLKKNGIIMAFVVTSIPEAYC